eukprot:5208153-Prymnesium_polylepis.2
MARGGRPEGPSPRSSRRRMDAQSASFRRARSSSSLSPPSVRVTDPAPSAAAKRPTVPVPQPSSTTWRPLTSSAPSSHRSQRHIATADGQTRPPRPTAPPPTKGRVSRRSGVPQGRQGSSEKDRGPIAPSKRGAVAAASCGEVARSDQSMRAPPSVCARLLLFLFG